MRVLGQEVRTNWSEVTAWKYDDGRQEGTTVQLGRAGADSARAS